MTVDPGQIFAGLGVAAAGVAGLVYLLRGAWRISGRVHRLADALLGDKEHGVPSVPERLGRLEFRVSQMELQLHPNGGESLHDKVTAIKEIVVDQP